MIPWADWEIFCAWLLWYSLEGAESGTDPQIRLTTVTTWRRLRKWAVRQTRKEQ